MNHKWLIGVLLLCVGAFVGKGIATWEANAAGVDKTPKIMDIPILPTAKAKTVSNEEVLNPENWHRAIFNGIEHNIYTGPGTIVSTKWAVPPPMTAPKAKAEPKKDDKAKTEPVKDEKAKEMLKIEDGIQKAEKIKPNLG